MAGLLDALFGQRAQVPGSTQPMGLGGLLAPEVALPAAAALLGNQGNGQNFANAFGAMGQGLGKQRDLQAQTAQKNRTLDFLRQQAPEFAQAVEAGAIQPGDAYKMFLDARKAQTPNPTDDMREYEIAKQQGFQGTFMDYQVKMKEAGRQQVNIDTGVKLPSGFRWKDPGNQELGVEPIPGGPATQIPSELAARVGMADSFLGQLPAIREKVKAGNTTGPLDRAAAGFGYGDQAATYRQIQSGVDALMRLLTGAGMNQMEAQQYAQRYLPTYADDGASAAGKLDQLERELKSAKEMAMRGRGAPGPVGADNDGWTDLGNGVRIRRKN